MSDLQNYQRACSLRTMIEGMQDVIVDKVEITNEVQDKVFFSCTLLDGRKGKGSIFYGLTCTSILLPSYEVEL